MRSFNFLRELDLVFINSVQPDLAKFDNFVLNFFATSGSASGLQISVL